LCGTQLKMTEFLNYYYYYEGVVKKPNYKYLVQKVCRMYVDDPWMTWF
jgi:hypothetical protein